MRYNREVEKNKLVNHGGIYTLTATWEKGR